MGCILLASIFYIGPQVVGMKAIAAIIFIFLTTPVGAHMISKAAYKRRVPLYKGSICDELGPAYQESDYCDPKSVDQD